MMIVVDLMIALPKDAVVDVLDLGQRALMRLQTLEPHDALHDALAGALARIPVEIRTLEGA
jgi:hypothetical protein